MATYARIVNGIVVELWPPGVKEIPEGVTIDQCFVPEILVQFIEIPSSAGEVAQHWIYNNGAFAPPAPLAKLEEKEKSKSLEEQVAELSAKLAALEKKSK